MSLVKEVRDLCKEFHVDLGFREELENLLRRRTLHVTYNHISSPEEIQLVEEVPEIKLDIERNAMQEMMKEIWVYVKCTTELTELGHEARYRATLIIDNPEELKH
jgi:hypothetical protein